MTADLELLPPLKPTSVFILPGERAKNREDRLVVWNRIARSIVEEARPDNAHHVFVQGQAGQHHQQQQRLERARRAAGLVQVRVHDLKHTFGRRLRAAGVPVETRKGATGSP